MNVNFQPKQISKKTLNSLKDKLANSHKKMPPLAGNMTPPDIFTPGKKNLPVTAGLVQPPKSILRKEYLKIFAKEILVTSGIIAATLGTIIGVDAISRKLKAGKEAKEAALKAQEIKTPEVKDTQKAENDAIIEKEEEEEGE